MHATLLLATIVAGVGAITGEKTLAQSALEHAGTCRAGTPVVGAVASNSASVTIDVPGIDSLRCFAVRLANETGPARSRVERLSCDAPDRAKDLTCNLTLRMSDANGARGEDLLGILAAAIAAQLDASKLEILPDRIELAGSVPSENVRTELEAAAAKSGIPVRSFGLSVRAALKADEMPLLAKGTGPAQLHLASVTAPAALSMIGDAARPFVALADGDPLTGRLFAANRPGLAKALAAAHPVKSVPVAFTGKGKKVDLSFTWVEAPRLGAILGDVMNLNLVMPADAKPVTVFTKGVPADAAVAALAKALGLVQVRQGSMILLAPAGAKIRASGPKEMNRSLHVEGASAAEALSLLVAEAPVPFCLAAGKPVRARVRNATTTLMSEALRVIDGGAATEAAACSRAAAFDAKTTSDLASLKLIATLTGPAPQRALVRKEDGSVAILESSTGALDVTATGVTLRVARDRADLAMASATPIAPASFLDHRLVATLVSPQGSLAFFEGRAGRTRVGQRAWTTEDGSMDVLPGSVRLTAEGYDSYGYRTRVSADLFLRP